MGAEHVHERGTRQAGQLGPLAYAAPPQTDLLDGPQCPERRANFGDVRVTHAIAKEIHGHGHSGGSVLATSLAVIAWAGANAGAAASR